MKAFTEKQLFGKSLVIVSNREPYVHKKAGLSIKVEQSAGGLTSALDDVLRATGGPGLRAGAGTGTLWGLGAEIWDGEKTVLCPGSADSRGALQELLDALRAALTPIPGVLIEDKGLTASVHFRQVDADAMGDFFNIFNLATKKYEGLFRITSGKKVFEIRPLDAWNKGDAVSWIIQTMGSESIPLYAGDDVTGEDAFRAIGESGISVSVGDCQGADYYLKSQDDVSRMLEFLHGLTERQAP